MSHVAIAAALRLEGVSTPERLVAFSLASYANREHRAWPGAAAAAARAGMSRGRFLAARAGMSRGRFLAARDGLVRAGLVDIGDSRGGRGRSSTVMLAFAESSERLDAEINAPLFEAALASSRAPRWRAIAGRGHGGAGRRERAGDWVLCQRAGGGRGPLRDVVSARARDPPR